MNLVRRAPMFAGIPSIFDEFFEAGGSAVPAMRHAAANVVENESAYAIELLSPGFEKSDFELSLNEQTLTIKAENKREEEQKTDRYTRREFHVRSFSRSFHLPKDVDASNISARYENGILKLELPKLQKAVMSGKTIEIK